MPTSIHVPKPLLAAVDKRARRLKMSRNAFVIRALQKELAGESEWSPDFFAKLAPLDAGDAQAMDEVLGSVRAARTRKPPPKL
ncbi:MAG: Ribbon-helix-helix protein copG family [Myxococcaceae bacterium]|nr:Ribbon-helix-helix protein copG family [Myxococcaceae bacterium]